MVKYTRRPKKYVLQLTESLHVIQYRAGIRRGLGIGIFIFFIFRVVALRVDDWLWLQGQNQHKTTTKQIRRSPRKFSPNLERTGEDVIRSEDGKRGAK